MKILVIKNDSEILISCNGKKLSIKNDCDVYSLLINKSVEEIIQWYKLKGGE